MNLDLVKHFLRIDTNDDDILLAVMMDAVELYILDAVGKCDTNNPKVIMLYLAIMQDLYENRTMTISEAEKKRLAYTQSSILLQLQCEVEDGG